MFSETIKAAETSAPTETAQEKPVEGLSAPEAQEKQDERAPKFVTVDALHEERERRKSSDRELKALREQFAQRDAQWNQQQQEFTVGQQRLAEILQRMQPQQETPDKAADPLGYTVHKVDELAQQQQTWQQGELQKQQAWQQQANQAAVRQRQEEQQQQLIRLTQGSEQQFREKHPDYDKAVEYAKARRVKELVAVGYDEGTATQMTQRDAWQIAHETLIRGQSPAERFYAMSQAMGYVPVDSEEAKMDMQEKGQAASKPTGGAGMRSKTTVEAIATMSLSQLAKLSDEEFRAAMGG